MPIGAAFGAAYLVMPRYPRPICQRNFPSKRLDEMRDSTPRSGYTGRRLFSLAGTGSAGTHPTFRRGSQCASAVRASHGDRMLLGDPDRLYLRIRRLHLEQLEVRFLLSASTYSRVTPDWFAALSTTSGRQFHSGLAAGTSASRIGAASSTQWILRLTPEATEQAHNVAGAVAMFGRPPGFGDEGTWPARSIAGRNQCCARGCSYGSIAKRTPVGL